MPSYRRPKLYRPHTQPTIHSSDTDEVADEIAGNMYDPEYDELEQPLHGYPFEVGWPRWPPLYFVVSAILTSFVLWRSSDNLFGSDQHEDGIEVTL